jgi:hypothetical protein
MPLVGLSRSKAGIRAAVRGFRQRIERELLARGGGSIHATSRIHTCCTALRRHLEAEKRLADADGELTFDQWLALADRSVKWKESCDRSLAVLGLEATVRPDDPWREIYNPPSPAAASRDASEPAGADQLPSNETRQNAANAISDPGSESPSSNNVFRPERMEESAS